MGWKQVTNEDQEHGDEVPATVLRDDSLVTEVRQKLQETGHEACLFLVRIHQRENYCIIFLVIISQMASSSISNFNHLHK